MKRLTALPRKLILLIKIYILFNKAAKKNQFKVALTLNDRLGRVIRL